MPRSESAKVQPPEKHERVTWGDLVGLRYTFKKGQGLEMHSHGETDVHITVVNSGCVKIDGPKFGSHVLKPGGMFNFLPGSPHEIVALEDRTVITNIFKTMQVLHD